VISGLQSAAVKTYFNLDLARISASLIDSERAFELLSFNALDLDVRLLVTKAKTRMGLSIRWLQLDHQGEEAREPIVLAPTPNDFLFPVFQFVAVKDNARSSEVVSFDFIDISIAEFDLTIEESFLFDLVGFINSVLVSKGFDRMTRFESKGREARGKSLMSEKAALEPDEPSLVALLAGGFRDENGNGNKVYIEQLFLGVVKCNLSYTKGRGKRPTEGGRAVRGDDPALFLRQVAVVGGERLMENFSMYHRKSDVFASWSRQTSDEDRRAEDRGKVFK
jgi:hypothetical protein